MNVRAGGLLLSGRLCAWFSPQWFFCPIWLASSSLDVWQWTPLTPAGALFDAYARQEGFSSDYRGNDEHTGEWPHGHPSAHGGDAQQTDGHHSHWPAWPAEHQGPQDNGV